MLPFLPPLPLLPPLLPDMDTEAFIESTCESLVLTASFISTLPPALTVASLPADRSVPSVFTSLPARTFRLPPADTEPVTASEDLLVELFVARFPLTPPWPLPTV